MGWFICFYYKDAEYYAGLTWGFCDDSFGIKAMAAPAALFGAKNGRAARGRAGGKPAGSNPLEILAEGASGNNAVP
ncbi:hypothetical protein, partial [Enterobacter asburiae]